MHFSNNNKNKTSKTLVFIEWTKLWLKHIFNYLDPIEWDFVGNQNRTNRKCKRKTSLHWNLKENERKKEINKNKITGRKYTHKLKKKKLSPDAPPYILNKRRRKQQQQKQHSKQKKNVNFYEHIQTEFRELHFDFYDLQKTKNTTQNCFFGFQNENLNDKTKANTTWCTENICKHDTNSIWTRSWYFGQFCPHFDAYWDIDINLRCKEWKWRHFLLKCQNLNRSYDSNSNGNEHIRVIYNSAI